MVLIVVLLCLYTEYKTLIISSTVFYFYLSENMLKKNMNEKNVHQNVSDVLIKMSPNC